MKEVMEEINRKKIIFNRSIEDHYFNEAYEVILRIKELLKNTKTVTDWLDLYLNKMVTHFIEEDLYNNYTDNFSNSLVT